MSKVENNEKKIPEKFINPLSEIYKTTYKDLIIKYHSENIYYKLRNSEYADEVLNVVKKRLKKEGKGTQQIVSKEKIFESIKKYFSNKPIERAYVFGSMVKDTMVSKDSDIDILVVFKKPNHITLFDIIQMKEELSDKTGREIDLIEEGQELKSMKHSIQKEKVLVYAS